MEATANKTNAYSVLTGLNCPAQTINYKLTHIDKAKEEVRV